MKSVMLCAVCESADVLYRTTSADYGRRAPTVHTAPSTYWPRSNKFSEVCTINFDYSHSHSLCLYLCHLIGQQVMCVMSFGFNKNSKLALWPLFGSAGTWFIKNAHLSPL